MNDYPPDVYELIEGSSDTGYQIREMADTDGGWILLLAATGEVLDPRRRTLADICATVARYDRMNASVAR